MTRPPIKLKIGTAPKYMPAVQRRFLAAAQTIWGEINSETAEDFVRGIKGFLAQAPPIDPVRFEGPRGTYFGMLSYAYDKCLEVSFRWQRKWVVNNWSNFSNSGGSGGVVSPDLAYSICSISLVLSDFKGGESCRQFFDKIKNGDLPPASPGELLPLSSSMLDAESQLNLTRNSPLIPEPTRPIALAMIEMIRGNNSGPKFRKFPENKQADLLKAAQAALTVLKLPVDPSMLNPEEVVQAMDREVREFLLLGEPVIPDILLAALSALYGYCLVWAYGAEWKLAPKDEGDMLYVIGKGEDGWAQPSDLVRTALQGTKRSSLSSSFKSFHRP
jgi:hypothetical protein